LIVVVMGKRLEQQNTVEALNGDRDALKKEGRFFVLLRQKKCVVQGCL